MSGMLLKELLNAKSGKKMFYLIGSEVVFLLFLTFSRLMPDPTQLASYIGMLMGLLAAGETFNAIAIDEKSKWDVYARSLPTGAPGIVGAKYLATLIYSAAGTALGAPFLIGCAGGRTGAIELLLFCAASFMLPVLACSAALPLFYRFGYQKTNRVLLLLICGWPMLLSGRKGLTQPQLLLLLKLLPVIFVVVLLLSFFLSVQIYSRKEM